MNNAVLTATETTTPEIITEPVRARAPANLGFAGDVLPREAWERLASDTQAMLVDVRTDAEWKFVGTPDLAGARGTLVTISLKRYPDMSLNPDFLRQVADAGAKHHDTPLFFMCRGGGRSTTAAKLCTEAGYRQCFNISGGFEGIPDEKGQLGNVTGWKAARLPWRQS